MLTCPSCQRPATKRDGRDPRGRQRYACRSCGRDFTEDSASAFAGYRWPAEVILLAVRWSLSYPLSAANVMELLAERGIDVSKRTVLRWVQTFGPLLAAEIRQHRRPLGQKCYVDEGFFFRGEDKHDLYRAVDETGQVVDVLFRAHRDTESAVAFFRQALARTGWQPSQVISDHHQPYVKAVPEVLPEAEHVRTGLHRARGETTKPIERSHVFTRDRLRASRWGALAGLRRGLPPLRRLVAALPAGRRQLLAAGPFGPCVLHGDVHPGNAVIRAASGVRRAALLDWGRTRRGAALEDVSSWLQSLGFWEPEARRRHDTLLRHYLTCRGGPDRLDRGLRDAYWLAGACNALAGALRSHLAVADGWQRPPARPR